MAEPVKVISTEYKRKCEANPFPNEDVDPKIKEKDEFGLKVANAIYWRGAYDEAISERRYNIAVNRAYASGQQDPNQYKPLLDESLDNAGDLSRLNISWDIESPAPLITRRFIGRMLNNDFKIKAKSIDTTAKVTISKARDEFYGKMIRLKDAQKLEELVGIKLETPKGFIPKDEDELNMYMDYEYRVPIEIAFEELEEFVFLDNKFEDEIKIRLLRDLFENNKASIRAYYDENFNIRYRYVDIANLIHSYTSDPYYNDVEYIGEVVGLTIREIRKRSNGKLSEEALFNIAKMYAGKNGNPVWKYGDIYNTGYAYGSYSYNYDDYRIECLDFVFYTTDVYKYEKRETKHGGYIFGKQPYDRNPTSEKRKENMTVKQIEMEYEGLWVCNSDYMVQYGRSKNITRESKKGKLSPRCLKKWVIIEPNLRNGTSMSYIQQIRPNLDMIQLATLRKRHLLAEAIPPGLQINWDALVDAAMKLKTDPKELIKLYKQKGILIASGKDQNDNTNYQQPIGFNSEGISSSLQPYLLIYSDELNKIFSLLGLNTPADASQPDKRSLIGLEKMALIESNNATRELFQAYTYGLYGRTGKITARMIQDQIKYGDGMSLYGDIIGELLVKHIEFIPEDLGLCDIGIFIEAMPDHLEVQELLANIAAAMQAGEITYEDSLDIKGIMNTKRASRVLSYKKKKRKEQEMQEFAQKEQITAQREQAAAMAAAEAEKIKQMAKAQAEIAVLQTEYTLKKELLTHEYETFKQREIDRKGYWKEREIEKAAEVNLGSGKESDLKPDIGLDPLKAAMIPGGE